MSVGKGFVEEMVLEVHLEDRKGLVLDSRGHSGWRRSSGVSEPPQARWGRARVREALAWLQARA